MSIQYVFEFGEGDAKKRELLGGKGANLSEMSKLGIPVPAGFIISTQACNNFYKEGELLWEGLVNEIFTNLSALEKETGKEFGGKENPLLVSVRSGAKVSMPGMMDTILNLGLNFDTTRALAKKTGNEKFSWDCFRRFIQMYSNVVYDVDHHKFEDIISKYKTAHNKIDDTQMGASDWEVIVDQFLSMVEVNTGKMFLLEPKEQLLGAVEAVFRSWNSSRAVFYRNMNDIPHDLGTAVTVQSMVFGNLGDTSGTGVCFTRNPSTGENKFFGEFLLNAQGEDVVAGIRTPHPIEEMENSLPECYKNLCELRIILEKHFKDMQDIEFTIEDKKLYLLQTRNGKRSAEAAVKLAVDMVEEGLISKKEALLRVGDDEVESLLHHRLDPVEKSKVSSITIGLPASPGGASGTVVFTPEEAVAAQESGRKVILVRYETSPEDISGMYAAEGILTACGGMTSHAAVVARGMGKPCVCGATEVSISGENLVINGIKIPSGEVITIDGATGEVFEGEIAQIPPVFSDEFNTFLKWADEVRSLQVRTNADTPEDAQKAREFGAQGIGLCRTEHMFFDKDRLLEVRKMILTQDAVVQESALKNIEAFQKADFEGIFSAMTDLPVTVRLLDPPLHEFLPHDNEEIKELGKNMGLEYSELKLIIDNLSEANPMLGHRGCRLLLTIPGLLETQIRAILAAGVAVRESGKNPIIEIMIPLVSIAQEFLILKEQILKTAELFFQENNVAPVPFKLGTMIETPRACVIAPDIVPHADFFSFGTNDLTQMTFGFSRDDIGKFLPEYLKKNILIKDPFQVFDRDGVGTLVKKALQSIEGVSKDFKTSVCGEHGGNGESIEFFNQIGINTVSCSPFRVPVARVAAARVVAKKLV